MQYTLDQIKSVAEREYPTRFVGSPEHVAGVAYALASEDAAYITGAAIVTDGGLLSRFGT